MAMKTKRRLAAWGGAISVIGMALGFTGATFALEHEDCAGRPNPISAAYRICR